MGVGRKSRLQCLVLISPVLLSACGDRAEPAARASIITVDDAHFRGELGDGRLSLSEALEIAAGALPAAALGPVERALVQGTPGAASQDTIRFVAGLRVRLERQPEPVVAILPALRGTGDEVDGSGATIDGSALGEEPQASPVEVLWITDTSYGRRSVAPLLVVTASGARVHDLTVENVPGAALVLAGTAGDGVNGVEVSRNVVRGLGRNSFSDGIVAVGSSNADAGVLEDVTVADNVLADVHAGVVVIAGGAIGEGRSVRGGRLERVTVTRNRVERPLTAIVALSGQALLDAESADNLLADLAITDNVVDAPLDVGILVSTTQPFAARASVANRIVRPRIAGNRITSPPGLERDNTGLFITGGQVFAGGTSHDDLLSDLRIEDNVVEGVHTGLLLVAGDAERCGPCATRGSAVDGVTSRRNVWRARATGVLAAASASFESAGSLAENRLSDVLLEDEEIEAGTTGVVIAGGLAASLPLGGSFLASGVRFPGYREPATIASSRVSGFTVRRTRVTAGDGIVVQGGSVNATEDEVRDAVIERVTVEDSVVDGRRVGVVVLGGVVVDSGTVTRCEVRGLVVAGNTTSRGAPVGAIALDETTTGTAPPDSVRDNRVVP